MSFVTASSVITSKSWFIVNRIHCCRWIVILNCTVLIYLCCIQKHHATIQKHFIFILSFMPICYPIMDKRAIILLSLNFTIGLSLIYIMGFKSLVSTYIGGHLGRLPDLINPLLLLLFIYSFWPYIVSVYSERSSHCVYVHKYNLFFNSSITFCKDVFSVEVLLCMLQADLFSYHSHKKCIAPSICTVLFSVWYVFTYGNNRW